MFDVTTNALVRRINRRLSRNDEKLRRTRGARALVDDLGEYHIHDCKLDCVVAQNVDPETLGRELGVLQVHETVSG